MGYVIDDSAPTREVIISENKSGSRTVNGKSARQLLYSYRRKYGEKAYQKLLKMLDDEKKVELSK